MSVRPCPFGQQTNIMQGSPMERKFFQVILIHFADEFGQPSLLRPKRAMMCDKCPQCENRRALTKRCGSQLTPIISSASSRLWPLSHGWKSFCRRCSGGSPADMGRLPQLECAARCVFTHFPLRKPQDRGSQSSREWPRFPGRCRGAAPKRGLQR